MRESLVNLLKKTFIIKIKLPYLDDETCIDKSSITAECRNDFCFENCDTDKTAECIYNALIDYIYNESEIDINNLNALQKRIIKTKLRPIREDNESVALKYGFYGEVIMNAILQLIFSTRQLIAKGKFINLTDKREPTGYDSFHLLATDDKTIEFWFGEVKCYDTFQKAIFDLITKLNVDLSEEYLNENLMMILEKGQLLNVRYPNIDILVKKWENQTFDVKNDIIGNNFKTIVPCFIIFSSDDNSLSQFEKCIANIEKNLSSKKIINEINAELFFSFIPIKALKECKKKVIEWILKEESVIS